jgi:hypothetical protein
MVDLRQRQPIRDDRLPKLLVRIHDDVSGIEQPGFGQMGDRTSAPVSREHRISEWYLMQPLLDLVKRISTLGCVGWHCLSRGPYQRSERKLDP